MPHTPGRITPELAEELLSEITRLHSQAVVTKKDEDLGQTGFYDLALAAEGKGPAPTMERLAQYIQFAEERRKREVSPEIVAKGKMVDDAFAALKRFVEVRKTGDEEEIQLAHAAVRRMQEDLTQAVHLRKFNTERRLDLFKAGRLIAESDKYVSSDRAIQEVNEGREFFL